MPQIEQTACRAVPPDSAAAQEKPGERDAQDTLFQFGIHLFNGWFCFRFGIYPLPDLFDDRLAITSERISNPALKAAIKCVHEYKAKLEMKWPEKASKVYELFHAMNFHFCESTDKKLGKLRDVKDIPVLSDALNYKVDMILTGDKDFLEADLEEPLIFSPGMLDDFLEQH